MSKIITNPYDNKALTDENITNYLLSNELNFDEIALKNLKELKIEPFLQNDFGEKNDCTLVSIMTCVHYFYPGIATPEELYETISNIYKRNYPQFQKIDGTIPFFIKSVYNEVFKYYKLHFYIPRSRYGNGIGFNFKTIRNQLDQNTPVILSFWKDGRDFYFNHTVVVIGYAEFELYRTHPVSLLPQSKTRNMLIIYDNWSKQIRYLDPKELNIISNIVY